MGPLNCLGMLQERGEPVPPEDSLDVSRRIKEAYCYTCSDMTKVIVARAKFVHFLNHVLPIILACMCFSTNLNLDAAVAAHIFLVRVAQSECLVYSLINSVMQWACCAHL